MLKVLVLILSLIGCKQPTSNKVSNCFNTTNFEIVSEYLNTKIKCSNLSYYTFGRYELFMSDNNTISIKKNGWTLSKVTKEIGIKSLAILQRDNDKILIETNQIFCELLFAANNQTKE